MTNVKISSSVCRLNIRICTRVNLFNLRDNWTIHDFSRLFYSRAFIKIQHNWPILKSNPEIFENSRIFSNVYNFMGGALQAILIGSRYCSANRVKSETNLTATTFSLYQTVFQRLRCNASQHRCLQLLFSVTSMLVTNVGDKMCW